MRKVYSPISINFKIKSTLFLVLLIIKNTRSILSKEKLQLTKANTYNIEYKLYQLFRAPNISIDMQDSCNPLREPIISRGGGSEGGPQRLRIIEQHHKHNN